MRYLFYVAIVIFPFWVQAGLYGPPRFIVNDNKIETEFIYENYDVPCGKIKALGCAHADMGFDYSINCETSVIRIDINHKINKIEVSTRYPKTSCEYNSVLTHEQDHMYITYSTLQTVVEKMKEEALKTYDAERLRQSSCSVIRQKTAKELNDYIKVYYRESERLNKIYDEDEYGSLILDCKTIPDIKITHKKAEPEIVLTDNHSFNFELFIKYSPIVDLNISFIEFQIIESNLKIYMPKKYDKYSCHYKKMIEKYNEVIDSYRNIFIKNLEEYKDELSETYELMLGTNERYKNFHIAIYQGIQRTDKYANIDSDRFKTKFREEFTYDFLKECDLSY